MLFKHTKLYINSQLVLSKYIYEKDVFVSAIEILL